MSLISQPESYSQILTRIFVATLTTGILCTFGLAGASPHFHKFLEGWNTHTSIGIIDNVKALYVLVPLAVAIASRAFLLHDKISDWCRIRKTFDINFILKPLAAGVGYPVAGDEWMSVVENREKAMAKTFYRYASFTSPKIDPHLVRTAADHWGWFWCGVEPSAILVVASVSFAALQAWWPHFCVTLAVIVVLLCLSAARWSSLKELASKQVDEILNTPASKDEILAVFKSMIA